MKNFSAAIISVILIVYSNAVICVCNGGDSAESQRWLDRIDSRGSIDNCYHYNTTGSNVHAYIIDSGMSYYGFYEEFSGRLGVGYDVRTNALLTGENVSDWWDHGTNTAIILGGKINGVAKDVILHPVIGISNTDHVVAEELVEAMDWINANHQKPALVNMSINFAFFTNNERLQINAAIDRLISSGITLVAAAGNHTSDYCSYYPASLEKAIIVGAASPANIFYGDSNRGGCVDIYAPGTLMNFVGKAVGDSGTSWAAPVISGISARYLEDNPTASPERVEEAIKLFATQNVISGLDPTSNNLYAYAPPSYIGQVENFYAATPYSSSYQPANLFSDDQDGLLWYNHDTDKPNSTFVRWTKPSSANTLIQYRVDFGTYGKNINHQDIDWTEFAYLNANISQFYLSALPPALIDLYYDPSGNKLQIPRNRFDPSSNNYIMVYYRIRSEGQDGVSPWRYTRGIWYWYKD